MAKTKVKITPEKTSHKPRTARKVVSREMFGQLLYSCYNIGKGVEPGDEYGEKVINSALKTTDKLFDRLEDASPAKTEGIIIALRLFVETTCAADPDLYAQREIVRGASGHRHEEEGASIPLPISIEPKTENAQV